MERLQSLRNVTSRLQQGQSQRHINTDHRAQQQQKQDYDRRPSLYDRPSRALLDFCKMAKETQDAAVEQQLTEETRRKEELNQVLGNLPEERPGEIEKSVSTRLMNTSFKALFSSQKKEASSDESLTEDGLEYYEKGKSKAALKNWHHALLYYNKALLRQRKVNGPDHINCGNILHDIGVAWMMTGDSLKATVALEEALYIRQECLGMGSEEAAETVTIIWKATMTYNLQEADEDADADPSPTSSENRPGAPQDECSSGTSKAAEADRRMMEDSFPPSRPRKPNRRYTCIM